MTSGLLANGHPVRVLFIEQFGLGGLVHYAHCLCNALAERGLQVALLTSTRYELYALPRLFRLLNRLPLWNPFERRQGGTGNLGRCAVRVEKGIRYLWATGICLWTIWRERPDVVHTSEMKFPIDLLIHVLSWPSVVIHTCHNVQRFAESPGSEVVRGSELWRWAQALMYRRSSGVIFHAEENREEFREVFGFVPRGTAVIPHGEYGLFAPHDRPAVGYAKRAIGLDDDFPAVLFFGALRRYKGLDVLLEAFAILSRGRPGLRLVIAGAPMRDVNVEDLRRLAKELHIGARVIWHVGYVPLDRVHLYFCAADVVVYPYRKVYESGALRIAQALGRPVVVTDTGGLASAVGNGRAGVVVPPEDPGALAQGMDCLLSQPRLAASLAEQGQKMADTLYSWASVAEKTERFYRQVLGERCA
jgi:glycosyltransferase involved in cell wall biosynthesis